ncbi:MAG: ABC transporter permease [Ferruginibacter sp.]|nr:ABC transporter permease [Ferruginibacter sp.]
MISNYFKIAWRNLWKHKLFSFINIMGLGLAIPFALLSLMQVQGVYEFDNFHPESERIYRIRTDVTSNNGNTIKYASSPYWLSANLKNNYPCIENATKVVRDFGWELTNRMKTINTNCIYIEPGFFEMFGFSLEKGSAPVLPNTLVLTHEMAEIFFENENPVGKILEHPRFGMFSVSGVLKPFKKGTQFKTDVMVSMATFASFNKDKTEAASSTTRYNAFTFVLLQSNANPAALDAAVNDISINSNKAIIAAGQTHHFKKQAFKQISPDLENLENNPYVESLQELSVNLALAMMIIILAGFNYTNLTLARSLSRAKEVGIRKTSGASRLQLVCQFICEAIVISLCALIIGFVLLVLMKQHIHVGWITWEVENQFLIWTIFVGFAVFIGLLAGILPAWILSGFQPARVLKGMVSPGSLGKINFRKSLVVIQFVVTACFIFLIMHMYSEFKYMATDNENFNRKNIFNISLADNNYKLLLNDIASNKNVEKLGLVSQPFGGAFAACAVKPHRMGDNLSAAYYAADASFIENMQLKFVAGKNLTVNNSDSAGKFILLNERAVTALGLGRPREAIGKSIYLNNQDEVMVTGVLKDFCFSNYQLALQPLVLQYNPSRFRVISIKTTGHVAETVFTADIKKIWKRHHPHEEMGFSWYEKELYERYYPGADMKFLGMVSFIIFVIAIMGLLGIVTYTTEKRIKEIGIRKLMGASALTIVKTLSWSFIKLLLIAGCIALPVGYISGLVFLNIFTFHPGVNIGGMAVLYGIVFLLAIFTIAVKAVKAANENPVKSLRKE